MGAIAPIDFQKCLFAPINFKENPYCDHHFWQLMGANILFIIHLHPSIKNPKEGPALAMVDVIIGELLLTLLSWLILLNKRDLYTVEVCLPKKNEKHVCFDKIQLRNSDYIRLRFYEVNLWVFLIAYHRLNIQLRSWPLLSK